MAPERLQRRHPHPHRPLARRRPSDRGAGRLYVALPEEGRHPEIPVGDLPRRLDLRTVGLHRAGALRPRGRTGHRLLRGELLRLDGQGGGPLPRVDDRRRRTLPAQVLALRGHGLHDPRHGDGPLRGRQRAAALQGSGAAQRRRTGAPVQRRGQTLDREDRLAGTRRVLHRERNHRPRMREPAGQHGGRRHPQRLRGRLRVERQGVRRKTGRGTPRDDPHGRGDAELQIRRRTPDRRHERPLRIPQQRHRHLPRRPETARRNGRPRPRGAGLHHRTVRHDRPPQGFAGASGRRKQPDRSQAEPFLHPLPRTSRMGSDPQLDRRQRAGQPVVEGEGGLRSHLPQRPRRHLRQELLRTAGGNGHDALPLVLRAVGIHAARIDGLLGTDAHHHAGRIRTLGRFSGRTRGRDARRTQRRQLRRSGSRNRQGAAAFHQIYPAGGRNRPQRRRRTVAHGPVERTLRSLRKSLFRSDRTFGDPYQPCGAQRRRRYDRTDQFRAAAAHHRKTALEPRDGREGASQASPRPRSALAQPLVELDQRRPRPVRVHRPEVVVGVREEPDRIPRPAAARTVAGVGTGRFVPCDARRRLRHVQRIHERKTRSEGADDRLLLDGIRTALVVEDLFGRPGHPRRRLPQRGVGQERADGCHGAALPLRLLHAAALGAGGAGGDLRGAELLEAADFARARRVGQLDDRTDRPAGAYALGPRLAMPGRPHRPLPARHRLRSQSRRRPSDHPLPLRRRLGEPAQTGAAARPGRHPRPEGHGHQAGGLPLQRGPCGLHRHRAHPRSGAPQAHLLRSAGSSPLVVALHDAHPRPATTPSPSR